MFASGPHDSGVLGIAEVCAVPRAKGRNEENHRLAGVLNMMLTIPHTQIRSSMSQRTEVVVVVGWWLACVSVGTFVMCSLDS